jgi:hypothetical protein
MNTTLPSPVLGSSAAAGSTDVGTTVTTSLQALWFRFVDFIPQLLGAIIVLIIGFVLAYIIAIVVRRMVQFTGIDNWAARAGINRQLNLRETSRYALVSNMVASIVRWVIIIATIGLAANTLQLTGVEAFIGTILGYIPNVIVAIIILTIGFIAAQIVSRFVAVGEMSLQISPRARQTLVSISKWAIIAFSIMAALIQLNIIPQLVEILFAGLVFALSLAFGLGGRDHAREWIGEMRRSS